MSYKDARGAIPWKGYELPEKVIGKSRGHYEPEVGGPDIFRGCIYGLVWKQPLLPGETAYCPECEEHKQEIT